MRPASVMALVFFVERVGHRVQVGLIAGVELQDVLVAHARDGDIRGNECVGEVRPRIAALSVSMSRWMAAWPV